MSIIAYFSRIIPEQNGTFIVILSTMLNHRISLLVIGSLFAGFLSFSAPAQNAYATSCAPPEPGILGVVEKSEVYERENITPALSITLEHAYLLGVEFEDVASGTSTDIRAYDKQVAAFLENPSAFTKSDDVVEYESNGFTETVITNTLHIRLYANDDERTKKMYPVVEPGDIVMRGPVKGYCYDADYFIYGSDGKLKYALGIDLGRYEFSDGALILTGGAEGLCDDDFKDWIDDEDEPISCEIDVNVIYGTQSGTATLLKSYKPQKGDIDSVHVMHASRVKRGLKILGMSRGDTGGVFIIVANGAPSIPDVAPKPRERRRAVNIITAGEQPFPDISLTHKDIDAIRYLKKHNIFQGNETSEGVRFEPSSDLNRAELVTIVMRMLNVDASVGTDGCFPDVPNSNYWFHDDVCAAARMGIISGYPDGTFKPANTVNKAEAMKIILNAIGLSNELEMYGYQTENNEWFTPYVTLSNEWNLFDAERTAKELVSPMKRADAAQLLYRAIITGMVRRDSGDLPRFSESLAATYESHAIELNTDSLVTAFEYLMENGREYRNERLGFSLLVPRQMTTIVRCTTDESDPIVEVKTLEAGDNVYIGPEWYKEEEYLGDNDDGSARYSEECNQYEIKASDDEYFARSVRTRIVKNDAEIQAFIKDMFGPACAEFTRTPALQNGIQDLIVKSVGLDVAAESEEEVCVTNYRYVLKYNPKTRRILGVDLKQEAFFHIPNSNYDYPLDDAMMRSLRMF
jgi:hypothetical protein